MSREITFPMRARLDIESEGIVFRLTVTYFSFRLLCVWFDLRLHFVPGFDFYWARLISLYPDMKQRVCLYNKADKNANKNRIVKLKLSCFERLFSGINNGWRHILDLTRLQGCLADLRFRRMIRHVLYLFNIHRIHLQLFWADLLRRE